MLKPVIVALIMLATPAVAHQERSWHLLTQTYGGTISLLKDLTKEQCEFALNRAKGLPATAEEKEGERLLEQRRKEARDRFEQEHPGYDDAMTALQKNILFALPTYNITSGDMRTAECFQ